MSTVTENTQNQQNSQNVQGRKPSVSAKEFVTKWKEAVENKKSVKWLSDQLGMAPSNVYSRANNYREMGVNLPDLSTERRKLDIDELNSILGIESHDENPETDSSDKSDKS